MPSSKTIGRMQLDNFVAAIPKIYRNKDAKRSIWDVWMHANHHASAIGEEVRKGTSGREILTEIADFAMWLFTAVSKLRGEFGIPKGRESEQETLIRIAHGYSDLLWNKFPACVQYAIGDEQKGKRLEKGMIDSENRVTAFFMILRREIRTRNVNTRKH